MWPWCGSSYIHSALILNEDYVTILEDKINALIKAAHVNAEPFWPNLFAKALANVNVRSLIFNVGPSGSAPVVSVALAGTLVPLPLPLLRKRQWKPRKKNLGSLMMTWALVFLTKPLVNVFNKKLDLLVSFEKK